ncbi:MAG: hypothetical protein M9894_13835 [Planctomycetes bacterium]|nr:hypothetical protein [Planctomycetota bacterium]
MEGEDAPPTDPPGPAAAAAPPAAAPAAPPPVAVGPDDRARLAAALLCGLLSFLALAWLAGAQGITWDEARDYLPWVQRFDEWVGAVAREGGAAWTRARVDEGLAGGDRHPHLFKLLGWLASTVAPDAVPFTVRCRLGTCALVAATLAFTLHRLAGRYGWLPALGVVLAVAGQPRLLAHGSFLATDAPLACAFVVGVLACADADRRRRDLALLYVAVAAAPWIKVTGLLLPAVLGAGCLLTRRPRLLVHLGLATALGLALMALTYPPWRLLELVALVREHAREHPLTVYFLGRWYAGSPPWTWLPVMLVAVPPAGVTVTLVGGALALGARAWRGRDPLHVQVLVACALLGLLFLLPWTPRHDGVRQALPLFALLGVAGGLGLGLEARAWLARGAPTPARRALAASLLLLPASGLGAAWAARPLLLSTFSGVVGGLRGAYHDLRLEPTYWLDAVTPAVLDELNEALPPGARLCMPFPGEYPFRLHALGLLRPDIAPCLDGEFVLLLNRTSALGPDTAARLAGARELRRWERDGVPLLFLYQVR